MTERSPRGATPRICLFFIATLLVLAATGVSGAAFVLSSGVLYMIGLALWVAWFALLWVIARPATDQRLRGWGWLRPAAVSIVVIIILVGSLEAFAAGTKRLSGLDTNILGGGTHQLLTGLQAGYGYNDSTALTHQAAENLLAGENPYAAANIVAANQEFDNPFDRTTPIRTGRFASDFPYPSPADLQAVWDEALQHPDTPPSEIESGLNYPAGAFLLPVPFLLLGIGDLRWVFLILAIIAVLITVWLAPARYRLWLLLGFAASLQIWNSLASGETGTLFFPFLLLAWVLRPRNWWLSALMMGIAVSIKQVPWFFAPFFLLLTLRLDGLRRMLAVTGLVAAVFLAANLPFIAMGPMLWVSSVAAPMVKEVFPIGVGVSTLVIAGYWHMDSAAVFGVFELVVGVACLAWYYFNCRRFPYTGLILAVLPLFFAWRSMWSYFFYFDVIMFACIVVNEYGVQGGQAGEMALSLPV